MNFEVGTHNINKRFDCFECAIRFYKEIEGLKYLALDDGVYYLKQNLMKCLKEFLK